MLFSERSRPFSLQKRFNRAQHSLKPAGSKGWKRIWDDRHQRISEFIQTKEKDEPGSEEGIRSKLATRMNSTVDHSLIIPSLIKQLYRSA